MRRCRVIGTGACLPSRVVTNDELGPVVGMRPARITELFDVRERHWSRGVESADPIVGERCGDLAAEACRRALERAGIGADTVDTLVTVSTTPDFASPSMDYVVASKLGLGSVRPIDIRASVLPGSFAMTLSA